MATYADFANLDIRAGIVTKAEHFPRAKNPSLRVWVDFGGEIGEKVTSAQITHRYTPESLPGQRVLGLVNIGERNIAGFMSQFLLLGLPDEKGHIHLVGFEDPALRGAKLA